MPQFEQSQLEDLQALGLDWDADPIRQSQRHRHYKHAFDRLAADDLAYRCFCSRRDIAAATEAPHDPGAEIPYPGTCARLSPAAARNRADSGEPYSWRLRAEQVTASFTDLTHGDLSAPVDDFVLRRRDGTPSYHLAVVVDDNEQGVTDIVRGDDLLLPTTARHAFLYDALGFNRPAWRHVPLVLDSDGNRLAKREGPMTRAGLRELGHTDADLLRAFAGSLELTDPERPAAAADLLTDFSPGGIPPDPIALPTTPDPLSARWAAPPQPRAASRTSQ